MKPREIFALTTGAYLLMAWLGKLLYFNGIETYPALYALAFFALLFAGWSLRGEVPNEAFLLAFAILAFLGVWYFLGGLLSFAFLLMALKKNLLGKAVPFAVVLAVFLAGFAAVIWGIPLLKPELRYTDASVPFLLAGDLLIGAIAVFPDFRLLLLGETIALIGASRTVGLGVAAAYVIRLTYDGEMSMEKVRKHRLELLALGILLFMVFIARHQVTVSEYSTWRLGFLGSLLYRPASSYTVYERLFHLGMPFGNRELLFNPDPTGHVGRLFGKSVGYTYTLFGQPAYDFGIFGLLEALLLGFALKCSSRNPFTGTFALTVAIISLDIGIEGQFLAAILLLAYLAGVKGDE